MTGGLIKHQQARGKQGKRGTHGPRKDRIRNDLSWGGWTVSRQTDAAGGRGKHRDSHQGQKGKEEGVWRLCPNPSRALPEGASVFLCIDWGEGQTRSDCPPLACALQSCLESPARRSTSFLCACDCEEGDKRIPRP